MFMSNTNPLALVLGQRKAIEEGAERIDLTARQKTHLQTHGLIADAHETYQHPSGTFALLPHNPLRQKRQRVNLNGQTMESRDCEHCGEDYTPISERARYCSTECNKRARGKRKRRAKAAA